jgi:glutathione S-transferase
MNTLESAVSQGAYVAGETFTAADLYLGAHLGFGMQFGTIEKRPAFEAYWQRVSNRPAALRAKAIDDALVPPRPAA